MTIRPSRARPRRSPTAVSHAVDRQLGARAWRTGCADRCPPCRATAARSTVSVTAAARSPGADPAASRCRTSPGRCSSRQIAVGVVALRWPAAATGRIPVGPRSLITCRYGSPAVRLGRGPAPRPVVGDPDATALTTHSTAPRRRAATPAAGRSPAISTPMLAASAHAHGVVITSARRRRRARPTCTSQPRSSRSSRSSREQHQRAIPASHGIHGQPGERPEQQGGGGSRCAEPGARQPPASDVASARGRRR